MKKQYIFLLLITNLLVSGLAFSSNSLDSIGVTQKNGQRYIIHQVEVGETLYALSRMYGVDIQLIKEANREAVSSLSVGQNVMIPLLVEETSNEGKIHTVGPSETLYSISRQYDVQVDDLKSWNNLSQNSISIGQKLLIKTIDETVAADETSADLDNRKTHTVEQSETLYSISKNYGITTDELKEWNEMSTNSLDIGQVLIVSASSTVAVANENSSMLPNVDKENGSGQEEALGANGAGEAIVAVNVIPDMPDDYSKPDTDDNLDKPADKIVEKGLAEVIASTSDTKKYLALHRQAPIGTIMQVKNEMNGQSVFVRIVGSIQDTGDNSKVMLMISKKAFDRLGAIDKRFPVQVSYIP